MISITETDTFLIIVSDTAFHRIPLSYLDNCDISLYTKLYPFSPFKRRIILLLGNKEYRLVLPNEEIKPAIEMIAEKLFGAEKRAEENGVKLEEEESVDEDFSKL